MKTPEELAAERKRIDRAYVEGEYGEIGLLNSDNSYTVFVPGTHEVYVRINGDPNRTVAAINQKVQPKARLPVRMRLNVSKRWEIIDVEPLRTEEFMGEAAGTANVPALVGDVIPVVWEADQFKPGRVRAYNGDDLQVFMEELPYGDTLLGNTTLDLATVVGAITSGKKALIVISVDPSTNALTATSGGDVGLPVTLTLAMALAVAIPADDLFLKAYIIAEGATALPRTRLPADTDFEFDLRSWITLPGAGGGSMSTFDIAADSGTQQTISDGDTLTLAGGTGLSSVASATDTVTFNLDDTAVTPGSYTNTNLTVDAQGRITAASNGTDADTGITQLTGDVTAGPGSGSQAATLANSGVSAGSYTNASVTFDAKGRATAASSGTAPVTSVSGTAPIASSGGTTPTISLNDTAVTPGSYAATDITVDQKGRLTAAAAAASTGTGNIVRAGSPTIVTPTIADLTNMTHSHQNAAGGGTLNAAAIAAGTLNNARVNWEAPGTIGSTTPNTGVFSGLAEKIGGFLGTFSHVNTADRTYTFQDISFVVGRDTFIVAKNVSGSTIAANKFVYLGGASGVSNATIEGLAIANSTIDKLARGVTRASIANNASGLVQIGGYYTGSGLTGSYGLNYLSDSSAGDLTATPPTGTSWIQPLVNVSNSVASNDLLLLFNPPYPNNLDGSVITAGTVAAARLGTMTGATNAAAGAKGAAPQPSAGDDIYALSGAASYIRVDRLLASQYSTVTFTTTNVDTSLLTGSVLGSFTVPANGLRAGSELTFDAWGIASRTSGNTTIKFKWGATTVFTIGPSAIAWGTTANALWHAHLKGTVQSTGGSGSVMWSGQFTYYTSTSTTAPAQTVEWQATAVTTDTTATVAPDLSWTWQTGSTGQTTSCTNASLKQAA